MPRSWANWSASQIGGTIATGNYDVRFTSANATADAAGVATLTGPTITDSGHTLTVGIGNAYPGYSQNMSFDVTNVATVPAHILVTVTSADKADFTAVCYETYPGGYEGFFRDSHTFFHNPRRFTYTPLIMCKGMRPYTD